MNPETIKSSIQAVIDGITPLAQKMQIPLEKLFGWAVRENYVKVATDLLDCLGAILVFWITYRVLVWGLQKPKKDSGWDNKNNFEEYEGVRVVGLFLVILSLVMFFVGFLEIEDMIGRLINPEYHALMDIIDTLENYN